MGKWSEYLGYGWKLTELRPGTKAPKDPGWQVQGAPFNENALGAGLVHQWSGTCALDVDDYEKAKAWLAERGVDLDALFLDPACVRIDSGRGNHGKLLYALPEARKSKKVIEDKRNILDFRCIGNQDVLPPSVHPETGKPYAWGGADLLMGLPPLPAALDAIWATLLTSAASAPVEAPAQASAAELAELLASRDPDCDYLEWIKVGMAVHAATNGQGLYIWDNWSRRGEKYNEPDKTTGLSGLPHLMSHWKSFRAAGGVGLGTLLSEKVATLEDFPAEDSDGGEFTGREDDDTVNGRVHRLLQPRLVFLTSMGKFYFLPGEPPIKHLDEHANCGLKREDLNDVFLRFMPEVPVGDKGGFKRLKPLDCWRELPDPQIVGNIGFHPGAGRLYTDVDGMTYLNRYKPIEVQPLRPKPHELEAWEFLISRVQDEPYRLWLMQFFAFIMRNPGVKVTQAPLLYSEEYGTGKSTLMNLVPSLLYGRQYVNQMTNEMLGKSFNSTMADSWFIVLDELKTDGNRQDRVTLANKMKPWITDPMLPIERKGLDVVQVPNRLQITATSNFNDAVQIDDGDRRWAICEMGGKQMTDKEIADLYDGFLSTPRAAGVLKHIFSAVNVAGFKPTSRAPRTRGRAVMVSTSLGNWERRIVDACANGLSPFDRDLVTLHRVRDMLVGCGATSDRQVLSVLKRAPFNVLQIKGRQARMYCWRNQELWAQASPSAAEKYLDTGVRPFEAPDTVPLAIRIAAGDDDDLDDVSDLLGAPSG